MTPPSRIATTPENHLFAKLEKCQFGIRSVQFLGARISPQGIQPDVNKVKSIQEWPTPCTKKELLSFLGLANYLRKFVDNFSKLAVPFHQLCRKEVPYIWSPDCQTAFETIKSAIASSPILTHADPLKPFWVETDASDFALGSVLSQMDPDGTLRPCAFYSRGLNDAERNYCVYEKELLAIKAAFEEWRHYLEGAPHQITVFSDHKGLEFFADAKVINQRHARWATFFKRFDFVVKYLPGPSNPRADALSRRPDYEPPETNTPQLTQQHILDPTIVEVAAISRPDSLSFLDRVKQALAHDEFYQSQLDTQWVGQFTLTNGLPYFQQRLYLPDGPLRLEVLTACHDSKLAGHYGRRRTAELVNRIFYWPGMTKTVQDFCDSCHVCATSKTPRHLPYGPLMPLPIPDRPWSSIAMDFITDLPKSEGMTTILTVTDRYSKMAHFVPLACLPDAEKTAEAFVREIVRLHGLPDEIITDRGTQFTSRFWKRMLEVLDIKQSLSTAYHPQTNGQSERTNQTLQQYLRCYCSHHQDDWVSLLPLAEFSFNNTCNTSTKLTPFYVNHGYHPRFEYLAPSAEMVPKVEDRLTQLLVVREQLRETLSKALEDQAQYANEHRQDVPKLDIDDLVYLDARNITSLRPSKKLDYKKLGPFKVSKIINPVTFQLDLPPGTRIHPVFHASLLEKAKVNQFSGRLSCPPPILVNGEEEYMVKKILDSRRVHDRLQYLIDWEGYAPSERCWVDATDVHAPARVRDFHRRYPSKPSRDDFSEGEGEFERGDDVRIPD